MNSIFEEMMSFDESAMKSTIENGKALTSSGNSPYWKVPEGESRIRIIPTIKSLGDTSYFTKILTHFVDGHGYLCLNQTLTDKNGVEHKACSCPICNKARVLWKAPDGSEERALAKKISAKTKYVCRVIVRGKTKNGVDAEAQPEFLSYGQTIYNKFDDASSHPEEYGVWFSLKADGIDFKIVKTGTGLLTNYDSSSFVRNSSPAFTDVDEEVRKQKYIALSENLKEMSYSKLVEFSSPEEMEGAINDMLNPGASQGFTSDPAAAPAPATETISDDMIFGVGTQKTPPAKEDIPSDIEDFFN